MEIVDFDYITHNNNNDAGRYDCICVDYRMVVLLLGLGAVSNGTVCVHVLVPTPLVLTVK